MVRFGGYLPRTLGDHQSHFRAPWDRILGSESQVRALRVLEETAEPMSVRELARRTRVHLRAMQLAVEKLEDGGILERVGTGARTQVRLNRTHPLAEAVHGLFQAERARMDRVLKRLKALAYEYRTETQAIWLEGADPISQKDGEDTLRVGVLAPSGQVDAVVDALRESMGELMRREDVTIEVRGWTRVDLEATENADRRAIEAAIPLLGSPPSVAAERAPAKPSRPRSHADVDGELRDRGRRIAEALLRRPELVAQACDEVRRRLAKAPPQEARTLREWQQLLEGMSPPRLRRWLASPGEQATRLRQSMPVTLLKAAEDLGDQRHPG